MKGVCCVDRRADAEAGTSIVEVMVATLLLAVGVLVVLTSVGAAERATAVGDRRSIAAGMAADELEAVRARAYDEIGISATSDGFVRRFERRPTVTEAVNRVEATGLITVEGTDYDIRRHVTWQSIDVGGATVDEGYKQVTVIVSWTDPAGDHDLRQDTGIYAVGVGP